MGTFRAGVIGYGFGRRHAQAYEQVKGVQLDAIAELHDGLRTRAARAHPNARVHRTHEEMLAQENLDIVSVCVSHHLHAQLTIDAARAGARAVYTEKPMAMDLAEADAMISACQESGTLLVVGHQRRLSQEYLRTQEMIASGKLGTIDFIHSRWPWREYEGWTYEVKGGGALTFLGTHSFDIFRLLAGDMAWVQGRIERSTRDVTVETRATALAMSRSGIPCLLETGEGIDDAVGYCTDILGTRGRIVIRDGRYMRYKLAGDAAWSDVAFAAHTGVGVPGGAMDTCIRTMVEHIVESLKTGAPHPVGYRHGRLALELAMATYESERVGCTIHLPLLTSFSPLQWMLANRAI